MLPISIKRYGLALGLLLLASACAKRTGTPEDELAVREAQIRYQFTSNAAANKDVVDTFCIAMVTADHHSAGTDPPPALLERFNNGPRKVRKQSDCAYDEEKGLFEKATDKPALLLRTGKITWKTGTRATISGGYFEGSLSASGNLYYLEKRNGKWVVTKDEMEWIS